MDSVLQPSGLLSDFVEKSVHARSTKQDFSQIPLRPRTKSPAVVARSISANAIPATGKAFVQANTASQGVVRQVSQNQAIIQSSPLDKSQRVLRSTEDRTPSVNGTGAPQLNLQVFTTKVDELQEEFKSLSAQRASPRESGGSVHVVTNPGSIRVPMMQSQPASGQRGKTDEPRNLGPEVESFIKAAVDAKVTVVLDAAFQKFNSFAIACLDHFSEELEKDRAQHDQAVQEQIKELREEVDALKRQAHQVLVKEESTLSADTGASPSDNSGLPTIYEQGTPQIATPTLRCAETHQSDVNFVLKTEPLLAETRNKKKWETLLGVDAPLMAAEVRRSSEQVAVNTFSKPFGNTVEKESSKLGEIPEATGSKFPWTSKMPLPRGGDTGTHPSRPAYWDQAKIGVWYSQTSNFVRECDDPVTAHQTIMQRWASAESHIPPDLRPILLSGLKEMKQKVSGYFERQKPSRSPSREWADNMSSNSI